MSMATMETRQIFEDYWNAMSGKPKTEEAIRQYVTDPALQQHIREFEEAFPSYSIEAHTTVVEGDYVAVRCTFHGTHRGEFAGIAATGRTVSADLMVFYQMEDGRIAKFWLQGDVAGLIGQLTA
jgi:predicted ester cyclase